MTEVTTKQYRCELKSCGKLWDSTAKLAVVHINSKKTVRHFCDQVHLAEFYVEKMGFREAVDARAKECLRLLNAPITDPTFLQARKNLETTIDTMRGESR